MSFLKRIENVQNHLLAENIDFLIIDEPISILYLTGLHLSFGKLIISKSNARLFVDSRYIEMAQQKAICTVLLLEEHVITDFLMVHSEAGIVKTAFDSLFFSYSSYQKLKLFLDKLQKQASKQIVFEIVPLSNPLKYIRAIKAQNEISALRKSAAINWRGFEYICSILKEGITEKNVALKYEIFCRQNGADKLAFDPIICFGANSAKPHHKSNQTTLKENDNVLVDIGVVVDGYHSDMTRVVFFKTPNPLLEKLYSIVKKAHMKVLNLCRPGIKIGELDRVARDFIEQEGYGKEFLHALGHGIGLNTHEFPRIKFNGEDKDVSLKPNMVITIEPGIYKTGIGGVRYEDTIIITKDGCENFYTSH